MIFTLSSTRGLVAAAVFVIATLGFALPARPAPVTFDFTVRLTAVVNVPGAAVGSLLTGSYTFESSTPDDIPESWGGSYVVTGNYSFSVGSLAVAFPLYVIGVGDDLPNGAGTPQDYYTAQAYRNDGVSVWFASLDLGSFANLDALTSDALPLLPPDPSAFPDFNNFGYCSGLASANLCQEADVYVAGPIVTLTLAAPEPATNVLIAFGLAGAALRRSRSLAGAGST